MSPKNTRIRSSHLPITILLLWFLTGCGGGGGGSSDDGAEVTSGETTPTAPSQTTPTVTSEPPPPLPESPITELRVTKENDLRVNQLLDVAVEMSSSRSYLSICPDTGMAIDTASMSYDQCIARRPLTAGVENLSVDVANHIDALVAIIWFYEAEREPLVYRWQRDASKGAPLVATWQIAERN